MAAKKKRRGSLSYREANFRQLFSKYKDSARKRSLPFSLPVERFRELVTSPCLVCGAKPSAKHRRRGPNKRYARAAFVYNGIDRIDNKKGYIDGNCAPCCKTCNYAKGTSSLEEFLLYIYRAYHHSVAPALLEGVPTHEDEDDPTDIE